LGFFAVLVVRVHHVVLTPSFKLFKFFTFIIQYSSQNLNELKMSEQTTVQTNTVSQTKINQI